MPDLVTRHATRNDALLSSSSFGDFESVRDTQIVLDGRFVAFARMEARKANLKSMTYFCHDGVLGDFPHHLQEIPKPLGWLAQRLALAGGPIQSCADFLQSGSFCLVGVLRLDHLG